ncbi:MAG: hypothetical protein GX115_08345 [Ruminiclostridium sp.]|nr:hypothetical protein [Ruminiclostridium sp.]
METRKIKVISPGYMSKFMCLSNQCEDTCCKHWRIDIDYETYKRYTKITDPKLRYLVGEYVVKNKGGDNKLRYAMFKLREDKHCAFLGEEGLCMLQRKYGPLYLSNVCRTYPRRHTLVDNTLERSGTVSCPEMARQILFNKEPMSFITFSEDSSEGFFWERTVSTSDENITARPLLKRFQQIRSLCIEILQNRSYSMAERLMLLGLFTNKLSVLNEEKKWDEIQQHIDRHNVILKGDALRSMLVKIPSDGYLQFKMIMDMLVLRLKFSEISPSFKNVLDEFKQGIGFYEGITIEQAFSNYKPLQSHYMNMFCQQYPQVFENYYVNYAFSKAYPFEPSRNVFENYIRLVVDYAITKLFLVGVGAYHQKFDDSIVQRVFTGISLNVEHNSQYVDLMVNVIKKLEGGIQAYTAVLVQD